MDKTNTKVKRSYASMVNPIFKLEKNSWTVAIAMVTVTALFRTALDGKLKLMELKRLARGKERALTGMS